MARSKYKNTSAFGIIFIVIILGLLVYFFGFKDGFTYVREFIKTHVPFAQ